MLRSLALTTVAISSLALLQACAPVAQAGAEALTPDQLALLDRNLSGKVAGEPVACINTLGADQTIRVSDNILLYRVSGRLVYKNDLRGGCPGLARDNDVLVTEVRGSGPCRGDIIHLVDRTTGTRGPSCVLGDFTPYRTPPR
jgi:hypothetical protein